MDNKDITVVKFNACMNYSIQKFDPFELKTEKEIHEYDSNAFNKRVITKETEEYSDLLFDYFTQLLVTNKLNSNSYYTYSIESKENVEFRLDLLKSLRFLLDHVKGDTTSIKLKKCNKSYSINNRRLIFEIEQHLQELFNSYFKTMYSIEELDFELQDKKNREWITNWIKNNEIQDIDNNTLFEEILDEKTYFSNVANTHLLGKEIKDGIKRDFQFTHAKLIELNADNIEDLILEYTSYLKIKSGAPIKNSHLTILAYELSDLLRVNKYLNKKEIAEIDQIKLHTSDIKFIYNCLDFWGFIPDREENDSTPEKYLRTTLKQGKKYLFTGNYKQRVEKFKSLKEQITSNISTKTLK